MAVCSKCLGSLEISDYWFSKRILPYRRICQRCGYTEDEMGSIHFDKYLPGPNISSGVRLIEITNEVYEKIMKGEPI